MNDHVFGNRLWALRTGAGFSQAELGALVGVSNKAVSKWENGKAKPTTNALNKLAAVFGISVDTLLQMKEEAKRAQIHKIVITGGPCAGKTTAMSWIQQTFTKRGYTVLFVPETATELIGGGVAPWSCATNVDYQVCQMSLQITKEALFQQAASGMPAEKVLIVCDRGTMDNRAYMTAPEFQSVLCSIGRTEVELRDGYDAVFHLVTAAKGALRYYTLSNNSARTETPEQAAALDDRLISAWTGHPHLRVIDNAKDFSGKMRQLIREISAFLGAPEPCEIERKFLIEYPNIAALEKNPSCRRVEIIQTYLASDPGAELRVRQRGLNGTYMYYMTTKRTLTGIKRIETERRLTKDEYLELLMAADPNKRPIRKTRYCLISDGQYFEIDIYPFWQDKAILEIELSDEDTPVTIPSRHQRSHRRHVLQKRSVGLRPCRKGGDTMKLQAKNAATPAVPARPAENVPARPKRGCTFVPNCVLRCILMRPSCILKVHGLSRSIVLSI